VHEYVRKCAHILGPIFWKSFQTAEREESVCFVGSGTWAEVGYGRGRRGVVLTEMSDCEAVKSWW
jgi:hypothetical protein